MLSFLPTLKIHAWGGLGSQLFAVALASDLSKRLLRRDIVIVLHTGGTTRREPEVCELYPEFQYEKIEDFVKIVKKVPISNLALLKQITLRIGKKVAIFYRFMSEENGETKSRVCPWTVAIRGHYSYRKITDDFLKELEKRLHRSDAFSAKLIGLDAVIHYRLGDLLEIEEKSSVNPDRIVNALLSRKLPSDVWIASDSPNVAREYLKSISDKFEYNILELNTTETIWVASQSKVFIGTSSKVSFWITLLRSANRVDSVTLMPNEYKEILEILSEDISNVTYY